MWYDEMILKKYKMICVENEAKRFNMQRCFKSCDEWFRYQISVKENKLKNTVQINTGKTTLGCTKNGSERFSDENFTPQRTVQNGSVSGTVQNGSERFWTICVFWYFLQRTVQNGFLAHVLGLCFGICFFNIKVLSWKRGLKALKLLMEGKGSFFIKKWRGKEKRLTLCK